MKRYVMILLSCFVVVLAAHADKEAGDPLQDEYFNQAARRTGQAAAAVVGVKVLKAEGGEPEKLNEFAWRILTDESLQQHDYPLAVRAARIAFEKSMGKEFAIVDTYARALFMTGQTNAAIMLQQQAVKLCDNPKTRLELKETLAGYQHPAFDLGPDDNSRICRFVDASLALVEGKKTVTLHALLSNTDLIPCEVKLAKPSSRPLASEQLYEQARASVVVVGALVMNADTKDWDASLASGFIIHESGIFVTNFHVIDQPEAVTLTAMTADGHVYPVKSVLAVAPFADIAICQLEGAKGLRPLALVPNAKPGAHVRILSHPDRAFYSLTEGILSRYFVYRDQGKATTMLATTADFAVGSSGGPLFDDRGNVIGMVSSTSSIYSGPAVPDGDEDTGEEPPAETDETTEDENGDLQMVLKMCVPSSDILKLIKAK